MEVAACAKLPRETSLPGIKMATEAKTKKWKFNYICTHSHTCRGGQGASFQDLGKIQIFRVAI